MNGIRTSIRSCHADERAAILAIVNAAAEVYRGVIPADRWHVPYMPAAQLDEEIAAGVTFWGYEQDGTLIGVMGFQPVRDVDLIRHAYVLPGNQLARRWRRAAQAFTTDERAPTARWHLGRRRLGDPLLSTPRLRARLPGAQGRIAQDVLDYPGAADRDLGGAGRSAARLIVSVRLHIGGVSPSLP
jgi:hypothetical protein